MAVMKRLRDNTHIILWGLLIMFVLSMTIGGLVGGADITDLFSSKRKLQGKAGVVNGNKFDGMQYSQMIQNQLEQYRDNGQEITESIVERVSDQVWKSFINETLISEEVKRLGLQATDWEIYEYLMQYPPEFLINQEAFQTDGQFDRQKYIQALTNPQGDEWLGVEQYLRALLPFQKIRYLIENLPAVSDAAIKDEYIKTKVPFTVETLFFPFSLVVADSVDVTKAEIESYYKENQDDYFVPETRELDYVYFELKPTTEDSLSKYELAMDLKKRIEKGESFETVAAEYTEDPSGKNNGGDLGWFDQNQMVAPFTKAAFALNKGRISDPVLTQFGYHLIKVEDKRTQNAQAQVKARHILLKINPGPETLDNIRSKSSLFAFDASDIGFDAAADSHNVEIKSTGKINKENPYIPGFGSFKRAVQFAFSDNPVGTVSELLNADNGYAIFKLAAVNPEYYKPLAEVSESVKSTLMTKKRTEHLKTKAEQLYKALKSNETEDFKSLATRENGIKYDIHKDVMLNRPLKGISRSDIITGSLLALKDGQFSAPIQVGNQFVIVKRLSAAPIDEKDYGVEKEMIRDRLLKRAKTDYYNSWLAEMETDARIIDNRKNMY
ncbi:MAG: peptidylprolyl isomerase [Candidatus Marinimicrobia bacterium]|nr:peptidylprolyl isomerase [Candidatus Neomarinimicrobiota bacterium]